MRRRKRRQATAGERLFRCDLDLAFRAGAAVRKRLCNGPGAMIPSAVPISKPSALPLSSAATRTPANGATCVLPRLMAGRQLDVDPQTVLARCVTTGAAATFPSRRTGP
jgi:hypothetical protein